MTKQIISTNLLSKRELAVIQFIHDFGFCEISHVMKRFGLGRSNAYGQMKILNRVGMVNHSVVLPNFPGVYFLTAKAVKLLNSDLPIITYIPTNNYTHHMEVLNVYLKVREKYPDCTWITERQLIREKYDDLRGNKEHLPDGKLVLPDGKCIAIEVELSLKARERLLNILTDYVVDKAIYEAWYFCSPKIISVVSEIATNFKKIKTYVLNEELA
ncbi:MAG TPA: hypothetical protein VFF04_03570 [Candidatus Babeliales bacterium]|nr:hypothetical protein [Candidatus Babeliales bacterium]